MSSGRVHRSVGLTAAALIAVGGTAKDFYPESWLVGLGCALGATLFNPDLDVDGGYIGNTAARAIHLETPYKMFFRPYQLAYKHRSKWSHWPVLSTLWRIVYILFPLIVVVIKDQSTSIFTLFYHAIFAMPITVIIWLVLFSLDYYALTGWLIYVIIGLVVNDILHWIFDLW